MNMFRLCRVGSGLALVLVLGCSRSGESMAHVTGTVTFRGEPVEGANVAFFPEQGRPATGRTDSAGRFTLSTLDRGDGALLGRHTVAISDAQDELPPIPGSPEAESWAPPESRFPARYEDPATSGLTATVEPGGNNDFVFEMTDE